jgi:hypothetical protein
MVHADNVVIISRMMIVHADHISYGALILTIILP